MEKDYIDYCNGLLCIRTAYSENMTKLKIYTGISVSYVGNLESENFMDIEIVHEKFTYCIIYF